MMSGSELKGSASILILLALAGLLAACAGGERGLSNPALACQTIKCICVESEPGMFEEPELTAVLWRENGDAYCPEGFHARRAQPEDDPFMEDHGG